MDKLRKKLATASIKYRVVSRKIDLKKIAQKAKKEIIKDIEKGKIPKTVRNLAEVSTYVNVHKYGFKPSDVAQLEDVSQLHGMLDHWIQMGKLKMELLTRLRVGIEQDLLF